MLRKLLLPILILLAFAVATAQPKQPVTAQNYFEAGVAAQRAGETEKALAQYLQALKLEPKHFGATVNSGVCYLILEKYESAVSAFQAAARIKPDEARVQLYLGQACAAAGRSLEAIDAFK